MSHFENFQDILLSDFCKAFFIPFVIFIQIMLLKNFLPKYFN